MNALEKAWYNGDKWPLLLSPLEELYKYLAHRDQLKKLKRQKPLPVPVIVVGNITVGGTGKSPVVALLCRALKGKGWQPGVVSRGYGGRQTVEPIAVTAQSDVQEAGDEPVMLAAQTGCPVVVDRNRYRAASALLDTAFFQQHFSTHSPCDLIISDDGLQHLSLPRDIEWVVIDAARELGNQHCLPAGPLREPAERLQTVDLVLANGNTAQSEIVGVQAQPMQLQPLYWRNLLTGETCPVSQPPFKTSPSQPAFAMAGIGNPERFFKTLESLGVHFDRHPFPDHYDYQDQDLPEERLVLMTAKDAVKCRGRAKKSYWALDVEAQISSEIIDNIHLQLVNLVKRKKHG